MTAFDALRAALAGIPGTAHVDAHGILQALHEQGYAALPVSRDFEVGHSVYHDGRWIIMIDDLPKQAASEAHTILSTARLWQAPS
jgi:hypothetical protein